MRTNSNRSEGLRRRDIIRSGAWLALTVPAASAGALLAAPKFTAEPFALGIASGDPLPDGVVLWTRLMPDPAREAAWQRENVEVEWVVAEDEQLRRVVKRGREVATPELGHSVHADVRGLNAGRWYYYQFRVAGAASKVGRTRTASGGPLNFAFASCQNWEQGLYTAYDHMVRENLDLVVHLGDYIYEGAARTDRVRRHNSAELNTLSDYRNRYALYRSDPALREAHRVFPWIVTWDDHEVDNDYAADRPEDSQTRAQFLERRANAYQAYYESMPLRRTSLPQGSNMQLYRRFAYGNMAEFFVLDTRQYRTDQPCGGSGNRPICPEVSDPNATILGAAQRSWLIDGMRRSGATWNVLANQVMFARVDRLAGPEFGVSMDKWGAYERDRAELSKFFAEGKPSNPVVITGDVHNNWAIDLQADPARPGDPVVATEFVGTSISSGGDGEDVPEAMRQVLRENPMVKFYNSQRGYVRCSLTGKQWRSDYRVVEKVTVPGSPISTRAAYVVEDGRPGAVKA